MLLALWSWRTGEWADPAAGFDAYPHIKRKTKRDLYLERVKLGIIKEEIDKTALKVVNKALQAKQPSAAAHIAPNDAHRQPDVGYLTNLLMDELRVTVLVPDYTQAIYLALLARRRIEQDEEDALILLAFC